MIINCIYIFVWWHFLFVYFCLFYCLHIFMLTSFCLFIVHMLSMLNIFTRMECKEIGNFLLKFWCLVSGIIVILLTLLDIVLMVIKWYWFMSTRPWYHWKITFMVLISQTTLFWVVWGWMRFSWIPYSFVVINI